MRKILFLTLSPIDNDSRVQKEILFVFKNISTKVISISINTKGIFQFDNISILHDARRLFGIRGINSITLYWRFLKKSLQFKDFETIHCNDLNTLPIGIFIKFLGKKSKVIYDSHEYAINDVPNQSKWSIRLKYFLENILIRFADEVITVSESIANEYARLYNITKPHLILNCPAYKKQEKKNLFRESLSIREDQVIFLYQGGLSKGRGVETILKVFSNFSSDKNVLVCMGYGPLEFLIRQEAKVSNTIFFHPSVNLNVLLDYTSSADYGVLFYENTCLNHYYCSPNKIFEYLMAGLPVLTSNLYEMRRLVESESIGIVAQDNNVEGFKKAVHALLKQNYQSIQKNIFKVRKRYSWEEQEDKLINIFKGAKNVRN